MTSPRSRTANRLLAGLVAAALLVLPVQAQLPSLGDSNDMSVAAERRLGEKIARELYRDPDFIDDPVLVDYVRSIWQPLLEAARARGELTPELDDRFAWQVLLGRDRTVNAFAVPGGWLGLNLGLVSVTSNRDELASVLAHELSHVTQRHIARLVGQEKRQTPWVIGAMILGALAASRNPAAANAVIAGSQAAAMQGQLNFSRDMEREADRVGFGVLTDAGYQPQGFVGMFEKLLQASRLNDYGAYPYLRSHPLTTERVADMQQRLQLAPRASAPPNEVVLEHALMSGRARVISAGGVDALRALAGDAANLQPGATSTRTATVLYAAALASSRLREHDAAFALGQRLAGLLQGSVVGERHARLLAAELALAIGRTDRALALIDARGEGRAEVLLWAQARMASGGSADVSTRLRTWVQTQPRDASAWQMLAGAYAAQGQQLRALRAEAEAQVAHLDYAAAVDRFKAAQDLARRGGGGGDHIEASIIDTRARQVESMLREQALER